MSIAAASPSEKEYKETIFELLPDQGRWSEEQYLWLTDYTSRLVEFTDGYIELLPMPTDLHQTIAELFLMAFTAVLAPLGGKAHLAPIRLRVRPGKFREPDVLLVLEGKDPRRRNRYWTGADLTLEVVSPEKPERDLVDKRQDYAEARVSEYWIVNPQSETITVLRLKGKRYVKHGVFCRGQHADSLVVPGFSVSVADVFNVECPPDNEDDD